MRNFEQVVLCPHCGMKQTGAATTGNRAPQDGDISVCVTCAGAGRYMNGARELSKDWQDGETPEIIAKVEVYQARVRTRIRANANAARALLVSTTEALKGTPVPGVWVCPECGYWLHLRAVSLKEGAVGVDTTPLVEHCPNNHGLLVQKLEPVEALTLRVSDPDLADEFHALLRSSGYSPQVKQKRGDGATYIKVPQLEH